MCSKRAHPSEPVLSLIKRGVNVPSISSVSQRGSSGSPEASAASLSVARGAKPSGGAQRRVRIRGHGRETTDTKGKGHHRERIPTQPKRQTIDHHQPKKQQTISKSSRNWQVTAHLYTICRTRRKRSQRRRADAGEGVDSRCRCGRGEGVGEGA